MIYMENISLCIFQYLTLYYIIKGFSIFAQVNITNPTRWHFENRNFQNGGYSRFVEVTDKEISEIKIPRLRLGEYSPR
jgi:hypothetical protein